MTSNPLYPSAMIALPTEDRKQWKNLHLSLVYFTIIQPKDTRQGITTS